MKIVFYPICFGIGLFETLHAYIVNVANWGIWFSGHDYYEQKDGSLKCNVCGKESR
jgi:hypothetical protein